ncbi:MAG TPA: TSUP family transporter [Gaiellaceae bacterium]|nr:TSUP family transporter [Gaiellaceae bacterium]
MVKWIQTVVSSRTMTERLVQASAARRARLLDPQLVSIGLVGGLLSGLLGVGGGVVMVPLLVLWARYRQRDAHAASLGAIIPISLAGILTYGIAGRVHWLDAAALAVGAVAGARLGAGLLARIDERPLKLVFGCFLLAAAVTMGIRA